MNKTKYKILFIFTLSGIAVMTACGNTTESSAAPTPANSSVVLGESTEQSEASVDNDSITELDFSNINGFGVSAEYGDPYAKGKNWDITDETAITEFRQLLNEKFKLCGRMKIQQKMECFQRVLLSGKYQTVKNIA